MGGSAKWGGSNPIWVRARLSNNFVRARENGGKIMNKEWAGIHISIKNTIFSARNFLIVCCTQSGLSPFLLIIRHDAVPLFLTAFIGTFHATGQFYEAVSAVVLGKWTRDDGCLIFLITTYQNGGKYTKVPQNIPTNYKIYLMVLKYTNWP
jgi:hypothetical protein